MPPEPVATIDLSGRCEEIVHPALLSLPFNDLAKGTDKVEEWILTQFPTSTVKFDASPISGEGEIGRFSWSAGGDGFSLNIAFDTRYIIQFPQQYPTLGAILNCYGEPKYYLLEEALMGVEAGTGVRLELWYPSRGIIFRSETWGLNETRRYDINAPIIGNITITPSGSPEEMLQNGWAYPIGKAQERLSLLKAWPVNFTELVMEE